MASSPRDAEREEERRLKLRTLTIASAASAVAAAVTSQLWIAGTWIAAALTPVLVTLISEAMHRPTERIAQARTSRRPTVERGEHAPVRVYRQGGSRPTRRRIAIGAVAVTAALAFVIGIVALTTVDLVSGGSVGKGSGRTTVFGGNGSGQDSSGTDETQQDQQRQDPVTPPADQPDTGEPAPTQSEPEQPPSDTAPVPPPVETPPGEPSPEPIP
jgi:hypothetical protein